MLLLALALGLLIASPQLWTAFRYYPHSIRSVKTAAQKMELGNIPLWVQVRNAVWPSVEPVDGVFGPEACTFIGLPALLCVPFTGWTGWWAVLGLSIILSMGKHTPLFGWTHPFHLRIPARYCYFTSLSLVFLSLEAVSKFSTASRPYGPLSLATLLPLLVLSQMGSLVFTLPTLWPMQPYVQRWERPSRAFDTPVSRYLSSHEGTPRQKYRTSGLSYPLRTGQTNGIRTLGYNGGSQATWMQRLRHDPNPNGSGASDWFALNEDGKLLDWYGVKWAYTYRPLQGKWRPTPVAHLYENVQMQLPPSWQRLADGYEPLS